MNAEQINALETSELVAFLNEEWDRLASAKVEPVHSDLRGLYETEDGNVAVLCPAPEFMGALVQGGIIRHLKVIGERENTAPIFEGTGVIMGPMSEEAAFRFIMWKDIPTRYHNRMMMVHKNELPEDTTFRNSWRLADF